jgi:anti-sigma-K factor RskA
MSILNHVINRKYFLGILKWELEASDREEYIAADVVMGTLQVQDASGRERQTPRQNTSSG